jgi:hypothetical protein
MVRGDRTLGLIAVTREDPTPFRDQIVELLKTFADQAVIGARELNCTTDNGLQHQPQVECRAHGATDFAQGGKVAIASLHFLEEAGVLDGWWSHLGRVDNG